MPKRIQLLRPLDRLVPCVLVLIHVLSKFVRRSFLGRRTLPVSVTVQIRVARRPDELVLLHLLEVLLRDEGFQLSRVYVDGFAAFDPQHDLRLHFDFPGLLIPLRVRAFRDRRLVVLECQL